MIIILKFNQMNGIPFSLGFLFIRKYLACIICSQNEFQFRSIPFFKDVTSFFSDSILKTLFMKR